MKKEKTKLKNLGINKVDFVDEGANQDAHILIYKNRESEPDEKPAGFIKGLLDLMKKHKLTDPEELQAAIAEVEKGGSQSFHDKMSERNLEKTRDEMWSVCFALQSSLVSILQDDDLDGTAKKAAMEQSAGEFSSAIDGFIERWSRGSVADVLKRKEELFHPSADILKSMQEVLEQMIERAEGVGLETVELRDPAEPEEGGSTEMKIDKSKMTPEDKAKFEELAKAYGWTDDGEPAAASAGQTAGNIDPTPQAGTGLAGQPDVATVIPGTVSGLAAVSGTVDVGIEKGLHPAVMAELEALRKIRESFEERELQDVAKKYEIIGKKAEELVPVLKSLKGTGEAAYNNYIAVLDEMVAMQNASGMFSEIGKSGGHASVTATEETEAFAKARAKAAEIRKARPELTEEMAIDMAIQENPELQEALM